MACKPFKNIQEKNPLERWSSLILLLFLSSIVYLAIAILASISLAEYSKLATLVLIIVYIKGTSLTVNAIRQPEGMRLTIANSSSTGTYKIVFTTDKHPDLFKKKPDIHLVTADRAGKELYRTDKSLKPKIGRMEELKSVSKRQKPHRRRR